MWSAQATFVTTLALTYAQHRKQVYNADDVINQFMGVFFGFFRSSQIWGNIISTLILDRNETESFIPDHYNYNYTVNTSHNNYLTDLTMTHVTGNSSEHLSDWLTTGQSFIAMQIQTDTKTPCGAKMNTSDR